MSLPESKRSADLRFEVRGFSRPPPTMSTFRHKALVLGPPPAKVLVLAATL